MQNIAPRNSASTALDQLLFVPIRIKLVADIVAGQHGSNHRPHPKLYTHFAVIMSEAEARNRGLSQGETGYAALRDIARLWPDICILLHSMLMFLGRSLLIILGSAVVASPAVARTGTVSDRWRFAKPFHFAMLFFALLIAALGGGSASAQSITIDPASAREAAASTITLNHTVGSNSNRFLIVTVAIERDDERVTSVTYAGQAMTFVGTSVDPNLTSRLEVWRLIAPATGTNTVSVTLNASAATVVAAISFANVDQSNPIAASQFASGTGSSDASVSVASATDQVVLSAIAANDAVNSVTPFAGQASRWNVLNAADVIGAGSTTAGSSTTTMRYTLQSPQPWTMGAFSLRPSPPPTLVTNTNDGGAGSLRAAVDAANANAGVDTISFAIPGAGPHTITLSSPLPAVLGAGDAIDGTTQPGASCGDLWAGTSPNLLIHLTAGSIGTGLHLEAANLTVRGLAITGFTNKVYIHPFASNVIIRCNYIGLLPNGTRGSGNSPGVLVEAPGTVIGGLDSGEGNVISGNTFAVWTFNGSTHTSVRGNFIGTNPTGMAIIANDRGINHINGTGTWRDITRNLIAGSTFSEISVDADDVVTGSNGQILIQRNVIGYNRTQSAKLQASSASAILFATGGISNVLIGGDASSQGNVIGSLQAGVELNGVSNITLQGNTIAGSGTVGVVLNGVNGATIGGTTAGLGNIIGGNGTEGLLLNGGSTNITIMGNTIGTATIAGSTGDNASHGIALDNVSNIAIGNGTASGRNLIAGNRRRGIQGSGTNSAITINGNYIGTDLTGNAAVANGQNEGASRKDAISFDSGSSSNIAILNNVIGGYNGALVEFFNTSVTGITIQGNNLGVGADGTSQIVSANSEDLIYIGGSPRAYTNVLIGGSAAGQGNAIAFSSRSGIRLQSSGTNIQAIGNTIRNNTRNGIYLINATSAALLGNRIFANGLIGIDLGENGVTPNDPGDADSGANDLLNFPEAIRAIVSGANQLGYNFTLDAPAAANGYRIEFFASSAADPSGHGEGERFLGAVDITHAGGAQSFTGTLATLEPISIGDIISATTTRRTASDTWDMTSEFSAVAIADGVAQLSVTIQSEVFDPQPTNPFATPGNDMLLTTTVSNGGTGSTDLDSIFAVIAINPNHAFRNDVTPGFGGVVGFSTSAPALTFTPGTDLRFSNGQTPPSSLSQCNYTPAPGYDSQVRYVCLNPKGTLPSGTANGQFYLQLRARIN